MNDKKKKQEEVVVVVVVVDTIGQTHLLSRSAIHPQRRSAVLRFT